MALPSHLSRYQTLLDFLVEAALREIGEEPQQAKAGPTNSSVVAPAPTTDPCGQSGLHRGVDKS
jgi:hypothetical protein